ncbi:DNA replication protein psf2 [Entomophthora muscae]|uniref:DNA replication protein psf2 n=1 Tax=Entomophthora muscae TaxID=34485 RepID=A0ACC2RVB5_9FUNG|nr:DNA replication protein psf2 [Entomophthora muscae]
MALPSYLRGRFSPQELEFMAENLRIQIEPNFSADKIELISGQVGPFRPPLLTSVPVWFAILLRSRNKCKIVPPSWLKIESLEAQLAKERESPEFSDLPDHHLEVARLLVERAPNDLLDITVIRNLLKEIREIRLNKAREGLRGLNPDYLQMDNLSRMEINEIRPCFQEGFRTLNSIHDQPKVTPHHFFHVPRGEDRDISSSYLTPRSSLMQSSSRILFTPTTPSINH